VGWREQAQTMLALSWKQLVVMTRYPVEFVGSFATTFLILAMFTMATVAFLPEGTSNAGSGEETPFAGVVAYGFALFLFVSDATWVMGVGLRREQYEGTLEALYLTPASKLLSLLSKSVTALVLWDGLLALGGADVGRARRAPAISRPLQALVILAFGFSACLGIGLAFSAYTLIARESAETAANFFQFAILVLCAMFFPFSALPEPVLIVSRLIPFSYVVDLFRSTLIGHAPELAPPSVEWPIVIAFGVLMPAVSYAAFAWAERRARMTGSLGSINPPAWYNRSHVLRGPT
jgi:ABC-2 type transport system permease protein